MNPVTVGRGKAKVCAGVMVQIIYIYFNIPADYSIGKRIAALPPTSNRLQTYSGSWKRRTFGNDIAR